MSVLGESSPLGSSTLIKSTSSKPNVHQVTGRGTLGDSGDDVPNSVLARQGQSTTAELQRRDAGARSPQARVRGKGRDISETVKTNRRMGDGEVKRKSISGREWETGHAAPVVCLAH